MNKKHVTDLLTVKDLTKEELEALVIFWMGKAYSLMETIQQLTEPEEYNVVLNDGNK